MATKIAAFRQLHLGPTVGPTVQSVELCKRVGSPTDLHLIAETGHFLMGERTAQVVTIGCK